MSPKPLNRKKSRPAAHNEGRNPRFKLAFIGFFIFALLFGISAKAFQLQILNRDQALNLANRQHNTLYTLLPRRGRILDSNHKILTMNIDSDSIYVRPANVTNAAGFVNKTSQILGLPVAKTREMLNSGKSFIWLERLANDKVSEQFKEADIKGVGFIKEAKRLYPSEHLSGQVLGFTDIDSRGIEGIEYYFDNVLAGKAGKIIVKKDGQGRKIITDPIDIDAGTRGRDIVLTLDSRIQYIVEQELKRGLKEAKAESGMALIMEPDTGAILAIASYPFFDPNKKSKYPESTWRNLPIWYNFEPGSTMKIFLAAAGLEEKKVLKSTRFDCLQGRRKVANAVINDSRPHGVLTVEEIIKFSSNVCASLLAENLGKKRFYEYLKEFGFGHKTGVDLPGESTGRLLDYKKWGPVELATMSFGQGISVTSIQLVTALSSIANGGYVMKPYIVKNIVDKDGKVLKETKPQVINRVVGYDIARAATDMLVGVTTDGGTGTQAAVDGYLVAGKTGTAQIPKPNSRGYYSDRHLASFMGFAPAYDPQIAMVVVVDNPKKSPYGGTVAAPIFRRIAEKVLFHLGVPPQRSFAESTVMPNLMGMSAREILQWAETQGLDITFEGSGYAVAQSPTAGKRIKAGADCLVKLEQNQ